MSSYRKYWKMELWVKWIEQNIVADDDDDKLGCHSYLWVWQVEVTHSESEFQLDCENTKILYKEKFEAIRKVWK